MSEFTHNPTKVDAIQVKKPIVNVQKQVPFARPVKANGGRFAYFLVTDPKDPLKPLRAYEGDWIIRHPDRHYEVQTDVAFQANYGEPSGDSADSADNAGD